MEVKKNESQYPLFFEARDLTDRDKEKVRRHFQKRRDSGGGECGMIEETGDNTYKICFREKEDQERVLQRKFHTISLPSGELRLTVSRTSSPQTPNQPSTQIFTNTNTKGLEKIFKTDIYLLYYLRDNTKANKILQKQLSAIGCSVELDFDKEEAVVRGDIEKGPAKGFRSAEKWVIQVDRVFHGLTDNYVCHHVLDPKQIAVLLQDSTFATDDILVYRETTYLVVVGEVEAVKERIANLVKNVPIRKCIPIVDIKFKLVEEEFTREMCTSYSEVKILRSHLVIILEGPAKEVQSGAKKLDELMNKVKEKRVNLATELVDFLKSSGAVFKYQTQFQQTLRNPVSLEIASDLVLSSLSSGALDQAEAAILRDLRADTVKLQGAAAVPPDLDRVKDILTKAKNDENFRDIKVDFSFILEATETKVQLVGYSNNVNKLKEVLNHYLTNHVFTQELLDLPNPELIDCFDKVLNLIGRNNSSVTIKASHFPHPCLLLSGPRCLVLEAQTNLTVSLASLISDTLVLDGSGAQRYFQGEGKIHLELVETACKVIIREQQNVHSLNFKTKPQNTRNPSPITFTQKGLQTPKTNVEIKLGSLEDEQVNVLVAPMLNQNLTSTEIGKCLLDKAGNMIMRNFDLMAATCALNPGDVLQVDAPPSLGCSKIFFIECLPWDGDRGQSVQALSNGLKRCLELCVQQGWCSIAFPVIGPGLALQYPLIEATEVLTENIQQFGSSGSSGSLSSIHVVIKPGYPHTLECYLDVQRVLSSNPINGAKEFTVSGLQLPHLCQQKQQRLYANTDLSFLCTSSTNQKSVFLFLGLNRESVSTAMTKLKDLYQAQCSTETFTKKQLEGLTQDDINDLQQLIETNRLYLQRDQSAQGSLTVSGLKDGVAQVMQMMNGFMQDSLIREKRVREEEDLYNRVAWCILGHNGHWERLPKTANYNLENNKIAGGIVDAKGIPWSVDLKTMEAKRRQTGQTAKMKRLENRPDFSLPLYWDNMAAYETMKVVSLQSSSAEYQRVKQAFRQTVNKTIIKIERVQNIHLRQAYETQKKHISTKNNLQGGAGEKLLYHGTSQDNCNSIMKTGFNRSFAGQNATAFGRGTYFAVNASYSASPTYSKPTFDGSQLMFVARVLTGTYTVGRSDMNVPPPLNDQNPDDRYDSLVDNVYNPSMYVVFHDSQAYPDYLITFK